MTKTEEQINTLSDSEIVAVIAAGRRILKERFEAEKSALENAYASKMKASEGKVHKGRKARNAVAQAA